MGVFGREHHIECIRVVTIDNVMEAWTDGGKNYNADRFDALQKLYEGYYQTVKIPGHDGDWVCYMFPYSLT